MVLVISGLPLKFATTTKRFLGLPLKFATTTKSFELYLQLCGWIMFTYNVNLSCNSLVVLHIVILSILAFCVTFFIVSFLKKIARFTRRRKMYLIKQSLIKVSLYIDNKYGRSTVAPRRYLMAHIMWYCAYGPYDMIGCR